MTGVTWVAVAALVLSIINAAVSAVQAILRRSRLAVKIGSSGTISGEGETVDFHITILNPGRSPLSVYDLGMTARRLISPAERLGDQKSAEISVRQEVFVETKSREFALEEGKDFDERRVMVEGPDLPHRLDPQAVSEWRILSRGTEDFGYDTKWRGWATRLRASGTERRYKSRKTDTRRPFWHRS